MHTCTRVCVHVWVCTHTCTDACHIKQDVSGIIFATCHELEETILPLSWFHKKGGWWISDYYISQQKEEDIGIILTSACHPGLPTLSIALLCTQWITAVNIRYEQWQHPLIIPGPALFGVWVGSLKEEEAWMGFVRHRERLTMIYKVHSQL